MTLETMVSTLVTSSDSDLQAYLSSDQMPSLLHSLDDYLMRGTALQTRADGDNDETQVTAARALSVDASAVFSLFLRLTDASTELQQLAMNCGLLHVTRLVPFCQLYGVKNANAVADILDALVNNIATFSTTVTMLRQLYIQQLQNLHTAVVHAKRGQVVDLSRSIYELSVSLVGMTTATSVTELLLLEGSNIETELALLEKSMLYGLMQCYEASLPRLQRHVSNFDDEAETRQRRLIAETRQTFLQVLGRCVDVVLYNTDSASGEELLAGLHALSNGCLDDDAEHGSFLSDLWYLCEYKKKIADFFDRCKLDGENFSYLDMVIEDLPRRRILPTMLLNDLAAETKPQAILSANSKEKESSETSDVAEDVMPASAQIDETEAMMASMVHQVKDFFPDLGDGYVELCLLCSNLPVEMVVNFLLESNPPPVLLDVPHDLKRSDSDFARLEAQITGTPVPALEIEKATKLDPSRVWVGKKTMEKMYDPQIAKKDHQLVEKMKQLVVMYEEEDEYDGVESGALDEYDDDYNDEFDDFVPFSIRDGGSADDQDAICEQNRKLRAKEEKDAFWEDMKNRNREIPLVPAKQYKGDDKKEEKDDLGEQKLFQSTSSRPESSTGPKNKSTRRKDNSRQGDGKKPDEPLTPQQIQRQRARKDKNKAKVANHNRKDRAMKKMG
ncbi:hypothetical protein KXD40_008770 [Peronospora effusa]|uniref:CUE domain-containing protein n=1 Tax=Peronospora effusa TaxID=542832 RepID=A0A3M6VRH2_9STRA|nr:hypothetical protein DD238_001627 [Peronospora effusa]UIZ21919.1 hypothetical protein KXD40_008770 [Peronospora effusa]